MKTVHFGGVSKSNDGKLRSFETLCGLIGDCGNRDPKATTCKVCLKSKAWDAAVMSLRASSS